MKLPIFIAALCILLLPACKKSNKITDPSAPYAQYGIQRLNGTFTWKGHYFYHQNAGPDSTHTLSDTSFAILVAGDTTLVVWGDTLSFQKAYATDSTITFMQGYYPYFMGAQSGLSVTFWYKKNAIMLANDDIGLGGSQGYVYNTP